MHLGLTICYYSILKYFTVNIQLLYFLTIILRMLFVVLEMSIFQILFFIPHFLFIFTKHSSLFFIPILIFFISIWNSTLTQDSIIFKSIFFLWDVLLLDFYFLIFIFDFQVNEFFYQDYEFFLFFLYQDLRVYLYQTIAK